MSHDQLLEYEFESTICSELGERGWLYQDEGDTRAAGWDLRLALVPGDVEGALREAGLLPGDAGAPGGSRR